jgi:hypothetical protein
MSSELNIYSDLLVGIKNRVRQGQIKAYIAVNTELLATYWDIGKMIHERQQQEGWGKGVIPRLAIDLKNELSEIKGFSERNLKTMVQFYSEYQEVLIGQLPVAQLENNDNSIGQPPVAELENNDTSISQPSVAKLENTDNSISPLPLAELQNNANSILPTPSAKFQNIDKQFFSKSFTAEIEYKLNEMGV